MAKFWLCAAVGFYVLQLCAARIDLNISCRYAGVFHVEKNHRYSLTREEAVELCKALNSTIPTWEQMEKAFTLGFETCRYGYIEDKIVVPRHTPYFLCAANNTGIYVLSSNISERYDTYCFNSSESGDVICDPVIKLYSAWPNNDSTIEIFNADGSRYVEGKKVTERTPVTEDESSVGSGSAFGRGTADPNDITQEDDITTFTSTYGSDEDHHYHLQGDPSEDQSTQNPTGERSNHGKHYGNSSQDQQVTEEIPLWWPPEEHKGMQNATFSKDESSEDDDDGGGDDDGGDDEEGSGTINPETVLEWDNSGDKELQSSNTTVNSSKDVKQEESAHNALLHAVHFGRDSEVRYSTNDTRDDVLSGIVHLGDDEQYSTTTAVSSSDDFFKQEDSKQPQLDGAPPELETEDAVPTAISTSDVLHPEFPPSNETESTLEKESFHHPVIFFNGSVEHEEGHQHQSSAVDKVAQRNQSSITNRTIHGVLQVLMPPRESYHENASSQSAQTTHDGSKHEDTSQDLLPSDDHPVGNAEKFYPTNNTLDVLHNFTSPTVVSSVSTDSEVPTRDSMLNLENSEEKYHTKTSRDHLLPGILHPTATAVATKEKGKDNESTQKPFYDIHPGQDNEDDLPENKTRDDVQSEIIQIERETELETSQTAVISTEAADYEDSTQDSLIKEQHPDFSEESHPANSSINDLIPGISNPTGNVHENKTSLTVVIVKDHEDSAQQPLPPVHHPDWVSEEKPTNTSRNDMEISKQHENEHEAVDVVYDGTKEDSTPEPVRQWGSEDKYTTKATMDVLFSGIVPQGGINQKNKTDHTVVASSDGDRNEEAELGPQWHPTWTNEVENLVNNSQDAIIRHPPSADNKRFSGAGDKNATPFPGANNQPRAAHVPDWLIVVASLLALALILGVCIAVNSRRRCGQKKKLVINNGKGGIDEKKKGGLNGEASKSQEMVHLVHKEKPEDQKGPHDEFLAIDETQNQQDVALKSGM
ncbi:CD44 antigen isoform X1 [Python bivittatus]|uniref:CD44 antigen n=1 Tax=Python bivittatus TaxID=176946 RepID=A0A9F3VZS7_PYTBI|nr:CD44 antigen isoform X1 [Python bivittatus]